MSDPVAEHPREGRALRAARALVELWALLGGVLLVALVLLTAASAAGNVFLDRPIPGDFELVQLGIAVSAFAFLPYCQLTGTNVTADIFTANAGPRAIAAFALLASLVALAFACVLTWRMSLGLADYREYEELTPIVGFPIWIAFVPIIASLVLLVLASAITTVEAFGAVRRPRAGGVAAH